MMSVDLLNITPQIHDYLLSVSLKEHPVLQRLREKTQTLPNAQMQISPEQGQFMQLLLKLMKAKKTLEAGTFTGYSALCAALALPADGKVIACDISEEWTSIGKPFWEEAGVADKIDLCLGPALDTMQGFIADGQQATFDFIFIDADKANYTNYYEAAVELVRQGGLIAIDNTLWGGDVADPQDNDNRTKAIRALNDRVYNDNRVDISLIPIGDGLTLAWKK
jgi:predicted O-methyltransferase YrrM